MHRSPGIYLRPEEYPGKPQLGDSQMKTMRLVIKWDPLPPNETGGIAQNIRNVKGEKEGKDGVGLVQETCAQPRLHIIITLVISQHA